MDETRATLLLRLKDRSDQTAWNTFDRLYRPMLVDYSLSRGLDPADAEDVAQQCVTAVMEQIASYEHRASFKKWLRGIAEHKILDQFRKRRRELQAGSGVLDNRADSGTGVDEVWERQWSLAHLRYCAEVVRGEVAAGTFDAFEAYALEGKPVNEVAAVLGMTPNQIYVAKHRVLGRIRELMRELTGADETELNL